MDDPYVTCPYNRAHKVPRSRIQRHLIKCEQHYPPLAICPYNATHRIPHKDMPAHFLICSSKDEMFPIPTTMNEKKAVKPPHAYKGTGNLHRQETNLDDEWDD